MVMHYLDGERGYCRRSDLCRVWRISLCDFEIRITFGSIFSQFINEASIYASVNKLNHDDACCIDTELQEYETND